MLKMYKMDLIITLYHQIVLSTMKEIKGVMEVVHFRNRGHERSL